MLIYEIPFIQIAVPVVVVILCIFLVFAFGFKSPGVPSRLDIRDDDDKLQKGKRNNSKKVQLKVTDTQRPVANSANAKQVASVKQPSSASNTNTKHTAVVNILHQVKAPAVVIPVEKAQNQSKPKVVTPVEKVQIPSKPKVLAPVEKVQTQSKPKVLAPVEKVQIESKPKAKKQSKVVDENANISVRNDQVGDWTTAVSKKNRKNQVKKRESSTEEILKPDVVFVELKVDEEEPVVGKDLQVLEQELPSDVEIIVEDAIQQEETLPKEEEVEKPVCVSDVPSASLPELSVIDNAEADDDATDVGKLDAKKLSKKMKKKGKKVLEDVSVCEVDGSSSEASRFVAPELEQQPEVEKIVEPVVDIVEHPFVEEVVVDKQLIELNVVEEKSEAAKSSKKKKKTAESRKKFQETPVVKEIGSSNGDEFMVQVPPSAVQSTLQETSSSLLASIKISTGCHDTAPTAGGDSSICADVDDTAVILGENSPISEIKNATLDVRDDWKQAPVKRKRIVQKEH